MSYYKSSDAVVVQSSEGFELALFSYEDFGGEEAAEAAALELVELLSEEE